MARFLCAVHAPDAAPRSYALVEVMADGPAPTYAVRDLRRVSGDAPIQAVLDAVNSEKQYAGQTTVVTSGGQRSADAIHEVGPSAVAVTVGSGDIDAHDVSAQVLVDTFERLYRAGAVEVPGTLDAATEAIDAIYGSADLEAAAPDSDRNADGDLVDSADGASTTMAGTEVPGSGPSPAVIEQSGSEANVSTEVIEAPITPDEATAAAVDARESRGRIAADTGAAVDLGDHEDVALALALACWYGEASRDNLPQTDKADEALANRVNRPNPRN
ncbi:hypothetical protein [Rubrivirga sp.]|uniref:hypothetical protein n=1 Tax=Rubrivirga sp. TaxID=1885344 RepID=UPI003B52BE71